MNTSSAFEEGYETGRRNTLGAGSRYDKDSSSNLNPYKPQSKEYDDWQQGYESAIAGW